MTADNTMAGSVAAEASTEDDYLDFDLLIEKSGEGHRARVLSSPAGQAQHDFVVPFEPVHVDNLMLRFGRTRGTRRASMHFRSEAETFGRDLYQAVFDEEVRLAFRQSCDEAERQGRGLRLRLRLDDVWLETLPWEFLHSDYVDDFLVLSRHTPLVRFIEMRSLGVAPTIELPLRVLVMISSPSDHDPLDTEGEWQRLQEAMRLRIDRGEIELVRVPQGSLSSLRSTLQSGEYHIFHYIGHAAYDDKFDDGVLIMEGPEGQGQIVPGRDLGTILGDQKSLRLAVLNACEGARTSTDDRFSGVAQSLIRRQLPAVIAMQFEITDNAAITLSRDFYGALVAGLPVDAALSEARRGLFSVGNQVEWATPVLYQRSGSGQIFDIDDAAPLHIEAPAVIDLVAEDQTAVVTEPAVSPAEETAAVAEPVVSLVEEVAVGAETPTAAAPAMPKSDEEVETIPEEVAVEPIAASMPRAAETSYVAPAGDEDVGQWLRGAPAKVLIIAATLVLVVGAIIIGQVMNRTTEVGLGPTTATTTATTTASTPDTAAPTPAVEVTPDPEPEPEPIDVDTDPEPNAVDVDPEPEGADTTNVPTVVPEPLIPDDLAAIVRQFFNEVDIPLRIPLTPFVRSDGTPFADQLFFEESRTDATGYEVVFAATDDCNFAGACHVGTFGGSRLESFELHGSGEPVHLNNGQLAQWIDFECGASCGESMLRWLEGSTLYYVALKAGSLADLLELANAATDPRGPHIIQGTVAPQRLDDRSVIIDGVIDEWGGVTRHLATLPIFANRWDGVPDGYAQFAFGADDAYLYVLAEVFDDFFDQANSGTSVFAGDAVNVNIAQCCGSLVPGVDDFQLTVSALGDRDGPITGAIYYGDGFESRFFTDARGLPPDILVAIAETGAGYDVEIAIPRSYLGSDAGSILASINDSDGENRQSVVMAHVPNPFGLSGDPRNTDVIDNDLTVFSDPSTWGALVFG